MSRFFNEVNTVSLSARERLEKRYKSSTANLLLVAGFSFVNLVLLLVNSDTYFLFSSYIPYLLGDYAMFYGGKYPEEYYADIPDMVFFSDGIFAIFVAVAVIFILFYLLSWFLARKNKGIWLVFSLALFVLDTVIMFIVVGISMNMIMDIVFHIWVIISLSLGIAAHIKLKNMPREEISQGVTENAENGSEENVSREDSPVLRTVEPGEKAKVFVEADYGTMNIVFRRAKRVNELVVNGNVYAEYEVLIETAHTLSAEVNGHRIEAVYDGKIMCYINVDGKPIAKKARLI